MFEIEDRVVYGLVGVCIIKDIASPPIPEVTGDYYHLLPVYDDKGIIYSPVANKIPMRAVISPEECFKLADLAKKCGSEDTFATAVDPEGYDDIIKSQDPEELLVLIRYLFMVKNEREKNMKKMKSVDNRILSTAKSLLYGEMAVVLDKDLRELESKMDSYLSV